MTFDTFAKRTGWPREELLNTPISELIEILAYMGYEIVITTR